MIKHDKKYKNSKDYTLKNLRNSSLKNPATLIELNAFTDCSPNFGE